MRDFEWPDHIKFDDTVDDINEARRLWMEAAGNVGSVSVADFLEFMQAYADELESRRNGSLAVQKYA